MYEKMRVDTTCCRGNWCCYQCRLGAPTCRGRPQHINYHSIIGPRAEAHMGVIHLDEVFSDPSGWDHLGMLPNRHKQCPQYPKTAISEVFSARIERDDSLGKPSGLANTANSIRLRLR